jgi:hypothetical protein
MPLFPAQQFAGNKIKIIKSVRKPKTYMPFAFVTPSSPRGRKVP